jgi:hypothetical protein
MLLNVKDAIDAFKIECSGIAEYIIKEQGSIGPTLMMLCQKEGKFHPILVPNVSQLYNKIDKDVFRSAIEKAIKEAEPIAIAIAAESYMVVRKNTEDYDFSVPVSELPDRKEVVAIQIETYEYAELHVLDIDRSGESVKLVKDEELSTQVGKENTDGTFSKLLNVNYEKFSKELEQSLKNNLN